MFQRKAPEKAILVLNNYVYSWPKQIKLVVPRVGIAGRTVCVQVRYVLWSLIAKDPVHEQTFIIFKLFL